MRSFVRALVLGALMTTVAHAQTTAPAISFADLLGEMIHRDSVARWPEPAYRSAQFSSYDRAAQDPNTDWFANGDFNQFLRTETNGGRQEWVLMDHVGPGAVVRIWSANPPEACNLRFYFDGAAEPGWTVDFQGLTGGEGPVAGPLSGVRARGWNSYLPIPYAKGLKITTDKDGFYYQVGYRAYEPGTAVESFTPELLSTNRTMIGGVQYALMHPRSPSVAQTIGLSGALEPGAQRAWDLPAGSHALRELILRVNAPTSLEGLDLERALRSVIVRFWFDGEETVWVPLTDFFGSGVGLHPHQDWWRAVDDVGIMRSWWPMPYARRARFALLNLGDQPVQLSGALGIGDWSWDQRSMHFRANWHWTGELPSRPMIDYNYLTAQGRGVVVGDTLAIYNPVTAWWGEGDEMIFVDGEDFPSTFGTGTEDYYGYAWCTPEVFISPFHSQPRVDGPGNRGHTTNSRVRMLDAMPFKTQMQFDMELWHWAEVDVDFASTVYWYGIPGVRHNRRAQPDGAVAILRAPPPPLVIEGLSEAGDVLGAHTEGIELEHQTTGGYEGQWSKDDQTLFHGQKIGDYLELNVPGPEAGQHRLTLYAAKSWDYGIVRISVNGATVIDELDLWSEPVVATGPIDLGLHAPVDGKYVVRIEVVGKNENSRGTGSYFGVDGVAVTAP